MSVPKREARYGVLSADADTVRRAAITLQECVGLLTQTSKCCHHRNEKSRFNFSFFCEVVNKGLNPVCVKNFMNECLISVILEVWIAQIPQPVFS